MAWTITNWANVDWSATAILNEFVGAVNERKSALGQGSPLATVNVGDDVQAASFLVQFQLWIETYFGSFVVSHVVGDPWIGGHYDGAASIPTYANLAAVFSAAGLAHSNWRRYTTHPDEAGVVAYGQIQVGDVIGPWVFEDIQKCLNVLVWTQKTGLVPYDSVLYEGDSGWKETWSQAKESAEADWHEKTGVDPWGPTHARSLGEYSLPAPVYLAQLRRRDGLRSSAGVWNGVTRYADWYANSEALGVFDSYEDDAIEGLFSLWSQDEPATNAETIVSGTRLGSATVMPNDPWCVAPTPSEPSPRRGWESLDETVVLRWNVPGGFTYQ